MVWRRSGVRVAFGFGPVGEIPVDRRAESAVEVDLRAPTEQIVGPGTVDATTRLTIGFGRIPTEFALEADGGSGFL